MSSGWWFCLVNGGGGHFPILPLSLALGAGWLELGAKTAYPARVFPHGLSVPTRILRENPRFIHSYEQNAARRQGFKAEGNRVHLVPEILSRAEVYLGSAPSTLDRIVLYN